MSQVGSPLLDDDAAAVPELDAPTEPTLVELSRPEPTLELLPLDSEPTDAPLPDDEPPLDDEPLLELSSVVEPVLELELEFPLDDDVSVELTEVDESATMVVAPIVVVALPELDDEDSVAVLAVVLLPSSEHAPSNNAAPQMVVIRR